MRRYAFLMAISMIAATVPTLASASDLSDQQVAQQIADTLSSSGRLKGYSIAVKYQDGAARLEGWVRNAQQMEEALEVVQSMPEVSKVVNQLSVRHEPAVTRATPGKPEAFSPEVESAPIPEQASSEPEAQLQAEAPQQQATPVAYPQQQRKQVRRTARPTQVTRPVQATRPMQQAAQPVVQQNTQVYYPQPGAENLAPPVGAPVPGPGMMMQPMQGRPMGPLPAYVPGTGGGVAPAVYDQPNLPAYAWPGYAAYPNYAALTYPKQYSPAAWPYIGPFYPYPQVPLGWRKVTLEWDDGWWFLNFADDRLHVHGY